MILNDTEHTLRQQELCPAVPNYQTKIWTWTCGGLANKFCRTEYSCMYSVLSIVGIICVVFCSWLSGTSVAAWCKRRSSWVIYQQFLK